MRRLLLFVSALSLSTLCTVFAGQQPDTPVVNQPAKGKVGKKTAKKTTPMPPPTLSDEEALKAAKIGPTDGEALLGYLRARTVSDADQGRINEIIAKFGADDFEERVAATEYIGSFGSAAIGPLKKAERDPDPEIAYRARVALKKLEKIPHSQVAAAVVRAVVQLQPDGAAAALIGFLPLAESESLADVIRDAITELAVKNGKADPVLVAALTDKSPVRRFAAYIALIEGGPEEELIRIKDAYPLVRDAVLKETDLEAKFAGLWSLALTTREKEFIPALIGTVPSVPRGRLWQLEELLLLLAGNHPKDGRFLKSPESLATARDAWLAWWKEKGDKIDFVKFEYKPRVQGITDIIEMDPTAYGQGRVLSLGPDLKEKWSIVGTRGATDMKLTATGTVWVVETNAGVVTERDTTGKILTTRSAPLQPVNVDLLEDGGLLVVCRGGVIQLNKDGSQSWQHSRTNNYDIMAGCRLPNGDTLFVTQWYQNPNQPRAQNAFRLDAKGKDTGAKIMFNSVQQLQTMHAIGDDKVLVCERETSTPGKQTERVAEYDLKTGKQTWKYDCPLNSAPTSCQRLPNGNTLICMTNKNQLIEVDPSGEIVWEYQAKDNLRVSRAYRR